MVPLHEIIRRNKDRILAVWHDRVRGSLAPHKTRTTELLDSLPDFLDEVVAALQGEPGETLPRKSETAREHGTQRFRSGFSIETVVREYGVLRSVILGVIRGEGASVDVAEYDRLSRAIETGVADAVAQFAHDRDEQLEKQSYEQFAFLAHELRNPLTSSRLAISALNAGADPAPAIALVSRGLLELTELIDHALAGVRLTALHGAHVPLRLERVSVAGLLETVAAETRHDAAQRRVSIDVSAGEDVHVEVDPRLLRSAVTNLVRNAVKFSHKGGKVKLRARSGENRVAIEVEDECGGLAPGTLERLFVPFTQLSHDRSGFGLGLAIARQAVEAHSGSIQAHDLPGKGCVFMIDLPCAR